MNETKTVGKLTLIICLFLAMSGCLSIEVIDNVKNPGVYFRDAQREIARLQGPHWRNRSPEQIHILVYDKDERKIVKITTPVGLVDECSDLRFWIDEGKDEFDLDIRYDFNRRKFRNLRHKRPGLLTEINDRGNRVLIWLE
jgi:hypothetical protein